MKSKSLEDIISEKPSWLYRNALLILFILICMLFYFVSSRLKIKQTVDININPINPTLSISLKKNEYNNFNLEFRKDYSDLYLTNVFRDANKIKVISGIENYIIKSYINSNYDSILTIDFFDKNLLFFYEARVDSMVIKKMKLNSNVLIKVLDIQYDRMLPISSKISFIKKNAQNDYSVYVKCEECEQIAQINRKYFLGKFIATIDLKNEKHINLFSFK